MTMKESLPVVDASPKKPRRPPNGYNLFLKRHGHKAKERDRVWELYSRARNNNKKANKLARIATTGEIASLWGVDSEMRERFEREAKEKQELYRAQNETWRAAERFQFSQNYLSKHQPQNKARPSKATAAATAAAVAARNIAAAAVPVVVPPHHSAGATTKGLHWPVAEIIFLLL